ncbi:MAG: phosphohistidine phosphatase SixA [Candidatus Aminicenantes bacterium]|nr:MAG: phosphohistidine phosphatase SixA [Candidatus Aminicenantes bacterium]
MSTQIYKEGAPMKVYLVQHGDSVSKDVDPTRPLSEKGRNDVEKVAEFIKKTGLKVTVIEHSGKTRAAQTAEILNSRITSVKGIIKKDGISPNDPVEPLFEELKEAEEDRMIVGHLPFLGKLATRLLGGTEEQNFVAFQQGGVVCIEKGEGKNWQIRWMVIPGLLI